MFVESIFQEQNDEDEIQLNTCMNNVNDAKG